MAISQNSKFLSEVERRRTFAIISHPDSGKTTLTEKLLLYCGAIREAGEVKAKSNRRKTVSDWMELEQDRGISVTSSVLQMEYAGLRLNLLDTPGHKDFSEDTYRTLMAADTALMLMDAAKGVELQTRKLCDVCRMRDLPIISFINKMDRDGREPLELMQEIEDTLGIEPVPLTWPIGSGKEFKGVYHRANRRFHFFEDSEKIGTKASEQTFDCDPSDKKILEFISEEEQQKLVEDLELLDETLGLPNKEDFLVGKITPLLFGSARTSFGLSIFLELFKDLTLPPQKKQSEGRVVDPKEDIFSAFVFKIQANMDRSHRDRMAFLRICSGQFERDMNVKNSRSDKLVRLTHAKAFLAQSRETVNEAFAGDIVGIHDPGHFKIGDTLYSGNEKITYRGIPQFSPECFARIELKDPLKKKQLQKGVAQLCEEGLVQLFIEPRVGMQDPILGVVGVLQFDVMMFRLKSEYGVEAQLMRLPYTLARWVRSQDAEFDFSKVDFRVPLVQDSSGQWVLLFKSEWEIDYTKKNADDCVDWYATSYEALEN